MEEAKTEVFEKLEQLMTLASEPRNRCWWNTELCPFYSEVKGFQDATLRCRSCGKVDEERFFSIFKEMALSDFLNNIDPEETPEYQAVLEKYAEKAREEGIDEAYNELCEYVDGLLEKFKNSRRK